MVGISNIVHGKQKVSKRTKPVYSPGLCTELSPLIINTSARSQHKFEKKIE